MKVAIVCSNRFSHNKDTKKGTEIITRALINDLAKHPETVQPTVFASGDSDFNAPIESIAYLPFYKARDEKLKIDRGIDFELALISKAVSQQDNFDLYSFHIADGDLMMPFARFCTKPILITLHFTWDNPYEKEYFSLFKDQKNIFFVSISEAQRKILPDVNYVATIHHGINEHLFAFNEIGGTSMMWAGRAIPEKGIDTAIEVAKQSGKTLDVLAIPKPEQETWFQEEIVKKNSDIPNISLILNKAREELVAYFQKSKLFLFPIIWEEPFGLVVAESMSCGTPVVAYARGAMPELIKDGETGFLVNESDNDIRGNWIIKKTGIEGLKEAVEKIYAMSADEYRAMRKACRAHVEKNFTIEKMTQQYIDIYHQLTVPQET